jgi:hypothetical protein
VAVRNNIIGKMIREAESLEAHAQLRAEEGFGARPAVLDLELPLLLRAVLSRHETWPRHKEFHCPR